MPGPGGSAPRRVPAHRGSAPRVPGPGGVPGGDPPGWLLLRAVRILLECILVSIDSFLLQFLDLLFLENL